MSLQVVRYDVRLVRTSSSDYKLRRSRRLKTFLSVIQFTSPIHDIQDSQVTQITFAFTSRSNDPAIINRALKTTSDRFTVRKDLKIPIKYTFLKSDSCTRHLRLLVHLQPHIGNCLLITGLTEYYWHNRLSSQKFPK